jgi:hypothetical protein
MRCTKGIALQAAVLVAIAGNGTHCAALGAIRATTTPEETTADGYRVSLLAEGRGLEPPTPCGAPDFESGRWPIRLPSWSAPD